MFSSTVIQSLQGEMQSLINRQEQINDELHVIQRKKDAIAVLLEEECLNTVRFTKNIEANTSFKQKGTYLKSQKKTIWDILVLNPQGKSALNIQAETGMPLKSIQVVLSRWKGQGMLNREQGTGFYKISELREITQDRGQFASPVNEHHEVAQPQLEPLHGC